MTQGQWSGVLDVSLNGSSRYRSRKAGPHGAAGLIEVLASDRAGYISRQIMSDTSHDECRATPECWKNALT
jgi:hypothetical protein